MPLKSRNLRPHTTDARARNHAKRLAEEWRAAGLVVDLVEYVDTATDPGGYAVTARSSTSIMSCRCQSWVVRTALLASTRLVDDLGERPRRRVSTRDTALAPPAQPAGVAAAWEHERAWETVQDWIDGAGPLPATLDEALAALR